MGTKSNDIFEIQEKASTIQNVITGHEEGELWALAVHPNRRLYITASYDNYIKVWDVKTKVFSVYFILKFDFQTNLKLLFLILENNKNVQDKL